jgi:hypothetical protein
MSEWIDSTLPGMDGDEGKYYPFGGQEIRRSSVEASRRQFHVLTKRWTWNLLSINTFFGTNVKRRMSCGHSRQLLLRRVEVTVRLKFW